MPKISNVILAIMCALAFGGYKAYASMNEYAQLTVAKQACEDMAKEGNPLFSNLKPVTTEAWTKHDGRYAVVELAGYNSSDSTKFMTRICVVSKSSIKIVNPLQEDQWR